MNSEQEQGVRMRYFVAFYRRRVGSYVTRVRKFIQVPDIADPQRELARAFDVAEDDDLFRLGRWGVSLRRACRDEFTEFVKETNKIKKSIEQGTTFNHLG